MQRLQVDELVSELHARTQRVAVLAGHYCLNDAMTELSNDGDAEYLSFDVGIEIHKKLRERGNASKLYLWINDIGIPTESRASVKGDYRLPANYRGALDRHGIEGSADDLDVMFESTMRNRASVLLRKFYRRRPELFGVADSADDRLVRCVENQACELERHEVQRSYTVPGPDNELLVVKDGPNPKCNLILATLFDRLIAGSAATYTVNVFNAIYKRRIQLGLHVYRLLFERSLPYTNIYCDLFGNVLREENAG